MNLSHKPYTYYTSPSTMSTNTLTLDLTIVSANLLKHVTFFTKPRVYTAVSLLGNHGPIKRQITTVDSQNGPKPSWDFSLKFELDSTKLAKNSLILVFQLKCKRPFGDKDIGMIYVPVKEIYDLAGGRLGRSYVALPVNSKGGKAKGVIYLSYGFSGNYDETLALLPLIDLSSPAPSTPYWASTDRGNLGFCTPSAPYIDRGYNSYGGYSAVGCLIDQ